MLFVSPIRARVFGHERAGVSPSINAILEKVAATPGINRKQLAEHLAPAEAESADLERAKLALASDLRWLVSEGYVIEFNDGSLDLPRPKPVAPPKAEEKSEPTATLPTDSNLEPAALPAEENEIAVESVAKEEKPDLSGDEAGLL